MDYSTAIAHLKTADPVLGAWIDQVGDCLLCQDQGEGDLLFTLCESILYQQLSGKAAAAIHRRFLELYPDRSYPTAQDLLNTSDEALRGAGISRSKVVYMKDLAQKVLEGLPSLEALEKLEDEEITQTLLPIKGVGRWTVQMLLMFRLHRWDVFPMDDLGIRSGIRKIYELSDLPDKKTMEKLGQPWKPYRTIASWYLWRSLD
ncbi:MAG: DNA-3-methyladenine glycosylase [Oculatellaceae cyanobacterium Prado106]|jgi:DNA-3-methyladenine glycosylase II|nr:DNA-3-methyladenine glycosylase [Oculatellaceae cyanobacterium Prado106]